MRSTTQQAARAALHRARMGIQAPAPASYVPNAGSTAWKLCCFFACRPDEELTSADAAIKCGMEGRQINSSLLPALAAGYLAAEVRKRPQGNPITFYTAGPTLAQALPLMHQRDRSAPARLADITN